MDERQRKLLYWRNGRAWADLRVYADVGGKRMALMPPGQKIATKDPAVAAKLLGDLVTSFEKARQDRLLHGTTSVQEIRAYADATLAAKAQNSSVRDATLAAEEYRLTLACAVLYKLRDQDAGPLFVHEVTPKTVKELVAELRKQPSKKGGRLSDATVRHVIDALARLFDQAAEDGVVPGGYNPARSLKHKPKRGTPEKDWLENEEAARLLEAVAKRYGWTDKRTAALATFLLTGGRRLEVFGLEVRDVDFDGKLVHFRPNRWRKLKTPESRRVVPLWPQLEEVLRAYLREQPRIGGLLFPSSNPRSESGMMTRWDRWLGTMAKKAKVKKHITPHTFRHTYTVARLFTVEPVAGTDQLAGVSTFTVAKELGHASTKLVDEVYAHLPKNQVRNRRVEYRSGATTEVVAAQSATRVNVQETRKALGE